MKSFRKSLGIGALALALSGCENNQSDNQQSNNPYQTIRGIPISVANTSRNFSTDLVTVLDVDGRHVLAYAYASGGTIEYTMAVALIQSEISDGDEEPMELSGRYDGYNGNRFLIDKVNANGHQVKFK